LHVVSQRPISDSEGAACNWQQPSEWSGASEDDLTPTLEEVAQIQDEEDVTAPLDSHAESGGWRFSGSTSKTSTHGRRSSNRTYPQFC
jgi:hypothetical protein